jgi:hypothetical protein
MYSNYRILNERYSYSHKVSFAIPQMNNQDLRNRNRYQERSTRRPVSKSLT